jgi:hypothetical protein
MLRNIFQGSAGFTHPVKPFQRGRNFLTLHRRVLVFDETTYIRTAQVGSDSTAHLS